MLNAHPTVLLGNHRALDLLNTVPIEDGVPVDRLVDYRALVAWLSTASLITAAEAKAATVQWAEAKEGRGALDQAHSLRHALYEVVERIARGDAPSLAALARLNFELRRDPGAYFEVFREGDILTTRQRLHLTSAEHVLAPLYQAVAKLFSEVDLSLVRKCEDSQCVLFFYDTTKNHARRWCSMETCGNRNKVSAYRARGGRV